MYKIDYVEKIQQYKALTESLSFVGLLMIALAIFLFDEHTPFPSLYTLLPIVGTALILIFSSRRTIVGKLLSLQPVVFIGLISYSLYLWHQPIFTFTRYSVFSQLSHLTYIYLIIIIFFISLLSWKYIEQPFRNKKLFTNKKIYLISIFGSIFFIVVGSIGYLNDGFIQRGSYRSLFINSYQPDNRILHNESWKYMRELSNDKQYGVDNNQFDQTLWFDKSDTRNKLLLIGNSHSKDMYNILLNSSYANSNFQVARYGIQISNLVAKNIVFFDSPNYKEANTIVIATRYRDKDIKVLDKVIDRFINDQKNIVIIKNIFEFDAFNNKTIVDHLLQKSYFVKKIHSKIQINSIVSEIDKAHYINFTTRPRGPNPRKSDIAITSIAEKHKGIIILDRMDYACSKKLNKCFSLNSSLEKYFYDYGHHTLAGATFFGSRVDQIGWLKTINK